VIDVYSPGSQMVSVHPIHASDGLALAGKGNIMKKNILPILALFSLGWALQVAMASGLPPLADYLDEEGRLDLPPHFSGSLETSGYTMWTRQGQAPQFVRGGSPTAADGTWSAVGGVNFGCNGDVRAVATSPSGAIILGGTFSACGDVAVNNLAIYDPVINRFEPLDGIGSGVNGDVNALVFSGSDLYIGGRFSEAGGIAASSIARWDGSVWHPLSSNGSEGVALDGLPFLPSVNALAVASGNVYVGGRFDIAGENQATNIARWDGQWHSLGSGITSTVGSLLAVSETEVYAGGGFTEAGAVEANHIAKWDGQNWNALGEGAENGLGGNVTAITIFNGDLHVGGFFQTAGSSAALRVARWNGTAWSTVGSGFNNFVTSLVVMDGDLYAGGAFLLADGKPVYRLARWDGDDWAWLGNDDDTLDRGVNGIVADLAVAGSNLYAVGSFHHAGASFNQPESPDANRIIRWNGIDFESLGGDGEGGANQRIDALAVMGGDIFVGGVFSRIGGVSASRIARWDGSQWHPLGSGVNSFVSALTVDGDALYAGGQFSFAGGAAASRIARWQGGEWHSLGSGVNGRVLAIAVGEDGVYVGGQFSEAGGEFANRIARWQDDEWHPLDDGLSNDVYALAVQGSSLYVGGVFRDIGDTRFNHIARWDGSSWHRLIDNMGRVGLTDSVNTLVAKGSDLYVGGRFTANGNFGAGGEPLNRVARWDGDQWWPLGPSGSEGVNDDVNALAISNGQVLVGGDFTVAGGMPINRIAIWNGAEWQSLDAGTENGVNQSVAALDFDDGGVIHVGGSFALAGGKVSSSFARFLPDFLFSDRFEVP
jgi:trimeric autotransporter adhesin